MCDSLSYQHYIAYLRLMIQGLPITIWIFPALPSAGRFLLTVVRGLSHLRGEEAGLSSPIAGLSVKVYGPVPPLVTEQPPRWTFCLSPHCHFDSIEAWDNPTKYPFIFEATWVWGIFKSYQHYSFAPTCVPTWGIFILGRGLFASRRSSVSVLLLFVQQIRFGRRLFNG